MQSAAATDLLHVKHNLGDPDDVSDILFGFFSTIIKYNMITQLCISLVPSLFFSFSLYPFVLLSIRIVAYVRSKFVRLYMIHVYYGERRDKGKSPVSLLLRLKNDRNLSRLIRPDSPRTCIFFYDTSTSI